MHHRSPSICWWRSLFYADKSMQPQSHSNWWWLQGFALLRTAIHWNRWKWNLRGMLCLPPNQGSTLLPPMNRILCVFCLAIYRSNHRTNKCKATTACDGKWLMDSFSLNNNAKIPQKNLQFSQKLRFKNYETQIDRLLRTFDDFRRFYFQKIFNWFKNWSTD